MASNAASGVAVLAPGQYHFAIMPSDTVDGTNNFRGLYVGVGGDIVIVSDDGAAVTYKNAATGSVIPMRGKRVNSTGTTATNLVGLY